MPAQITTTACPSCGKTLMAGAASCHFCGASLVGGKGGAARPTQAARPTSGHGVILIDKDRMKEMNKLSFDERGYIVVAFLQIAFGILFICAGLGVFGNAGGAATYLGVNGAFALFLGLGLYFQQTWAQFLGKWLGILGAIAGFFKTMTSLMLLSAGLFGVVNLVINGFSFLLNIAMVYFIAKVGDV